MHTAVIDSASLDRLARQNPDALHDRFVALLERGHLLGDPLDPSIIVIADPGANDTNHVLALLRISIRQTASRHRLRAARPDPRPSENIHHDRHRDIASEEAVVTAMRSLGELDRSLLFEHHVLDAPLVEIARRLGEAPSTVRQRHRRALARLRRAAGQ